MNFDSIEYFVTVCDSGSISSGAHKLGISQQALIQSIRRMEKGLQCRLFLRSSEGITLTYERRCLYNSFKPVIVSFLKAKDEVTEKLINKPPVVTVKNSRSLFGLFFPDIYEDFRRSHPEIELDLEDCPDREILEYVLSDPGNIGLIAVPGYWKDERIRRVVVKSYELQLCLHKDNPLAGRRKVCVGDLEREKILLFDDRSFNKSLI